MYFFVEISPSVPKMKARIYFLFSHVVQVSWGRFPAGPDLNKLVVHFTMQRNWKGGGNKRGLGTPQGQILVSVSTRKKRKYFSEHMNNYMIRKD